MKVHKRHTKRRKIVRRNKSCKSRRNKRVLTKKMVGFGVFADGLYSAFISKEQIDEFFTMFENYEFEKLKKNATFNRYILEKADDDIKIYETFIQNYNNILNDNDKFEKFKNKNSNRSNITKDDIKRYIEEAQKMIDDIYRLNWIYTELYFNWDNYKNLTKEEHSQLDIEDITPKIIEKIPDEEPIYEEPIPIYEKPKKQRFFKNLLFNKTRKNDGKNDGKRGFFSKLFRKTRKTQQTE